LAKEILTLADELTQQLVDLLDLPARRQYRLFYSREDLAELRVIVFPGAEETEIVDREGDRRTVAINVAFVQAIDPDDEEQVDGLVDLVDDTKALWRDGGALRNLQIEGYTWSGRIVHEPLWNAERLHANNEFLAIVTVAYVKV
jgi:hypothetical protein